MEQWGRAKGLRVKLEDVNFGAVRIWLKGPMSGRPSSSLPFVRFTQVCQIDTLQRRLNSPAFEIYPQNGSRFGSKFKFILRMGPVLPINKNLSPEKAFLRRQIKIYRRNGIHSGDKFSIFDEKEAKGSGSLVLCPF